MTVRPDAGDFVMPFGKFKGMSLYDISETDEGLQYLAWAAGEFDDGPAGQAIREFTERDTIARDIDEAENSDGLTEDDLFDDN